MEYKTISALENDGSLDLDILNDLAANDEFLKSQLLPVLTINSLGTIAKTETGTKYRIQAGIVTVPSFKGNKSILIKFPVAHITSTTPIVNVTAYSKSNINLTTSAAGATGFTVHLFPQSTKTTIKGAYVMWCAVTKTE